MNASSDADADADREPAAPAPPDGLAGRAPVHNLLHDLALELRWSLLLNVLLAAALLPAALTLAWQALHPPEPEYFATAADGRITPLVPIDEPYVPQEALLTWVAQAVNQAYTLDHVHRKEQLSRMRELFTAAGFESHRRALEDSGLWEAVGARRLVTQVVTAAPPVVTHQGVLARRYAWKLEVPIKISYEGASSVSPPQNNIAEVLVVRMPTHAIPRGYAIHQLVTRPGGGS
jgi:intracellular multiplication protein IcmL